MRLSVTATRVTTNVREIKTVCYRYEGKDEYAENNSAYYL